MKRILYLIMSCVLPLSLSAGGSPGSGSPGSGSPGSGQWTASIEQMAQPPLLKQPSPVSAESLKPDEDMVNIQIAAGDNTFSAKLYNNQTTQALIERMPMTVTMDELNGNEKFHYLSEPLPTDSNKPEKIKAGDLMLFGSDCLVLFYESFETSFSYTRIGFIENAAGLSNALGSRNVQVTFRLE